MIEYFEKWGVLRKSVGIATLWMTVTAFQWSLAFIESSDKTGSEISMIIAAIMGPITMLQGAIFKFRDPGGKDG